MKKHHDIGLSFAQLLLLLTLTNVSSAMGARPAELQSAEIHAAWRVELAHKDDATSLPSGDRCSIRYFDSPGVVWIEVRSTYPDTSPALLIMDADGPHDPRMVERREFIAYRVTRPGEHILCRTSQAPFGDAQVVIRAEKSDELETEVDEDPVTSGEKSDELETEVDEDP